MSAHLDWKAVDANQVSVKVSSVSGEFLELMVTQVTRGLLHHPEVPVSLQTTTLPKHPRPVVYSFSVLSEERGPGRMSLVHPEP